MKYINEINEFEREKKPITGMTRAARYDKTENRFLFDPAEKTIPTTTFFLHNGKLGFVMEIKEEDQKAMEDLLKRSNVDYTISVGNNLPF